MEITITGNDEIRLLSCSQSKEKKDEKSIDIIAIKQKNKQTN